MINTIIPLEALDDRIAIVGAAGSGKTYTAGLLVESLAKNKRRTIIIDPLGAWWGLRLMQDGKTPAFPFVIFGGAHGDLPLIEGAGAVIGEACSQMAEPAVCASGSLF